MLGGFEVLAGLGLLIRLSRQKLHSPSHCSSFTLSEDSRSCASKSVPQILLLLLMISWPLHFRLPLLWLLDMARLLGDI